MNLGEKKIILITGILFVLIALGLGGLDVYRLTHFDRVESMLTIKQRYKAGKKAHVTYEYQGEYYEDKILSSYNAFTMKNGKNYTVLIDPAMPDNPYATSFALEVMFLILGIILIIAVKRQKE